MALPGAVAETLRRATNLSDRRIKALTKNYKAGQPAATQDVEKCLATVNLTFDAVLARALANVFDQIDRLDRSITIAEGRRNAALRELDRHRTSFAQRLREQTRQLEDVEFKKIESASIAPDTASIKGPS